MNLQLVILQLGGTMLVISMYAFTKRSRLVRKLLTRGSLSMLLVVAICLCRIC